VQSRKYLSEFLGTGILVAVVVGSGIMATKLTNDTGIRLLINTIATVLALGILISIFAPISGAHFNPVVTLAELPFKRISASSASGYILAQVLGGVCGAVVANLMFKLPAIQMSPHTRSGANIFLGEVVATAGLLLIIQVLGYQKRGYLAPVLVAGWIGSAYFFTSSTSFANPAVTFARGFSNSFSGIALHSVPLFILAQIIGAGIGTFLALALREGDRHE
jgi:glycerol uptake facilitator-like aquaporin